VASLVDLSQGFLPTWLCINVIMLLLLSLLFKANKYLLLLLLFLLLYVDFTVYLRCFSVVFVVHLYVSCNTGAIAMHRFIVILQANNVDPP